MTDEVAVVLAKEIDALYRAAPPLWQDKPGARQTMRQTVRHRAFDAGIDEIAAFTEQVEDFALKVFRKD